MRRRLLPALALPLLASCAAPQPPLCFVEPVAYEEPAPPPAPRTVLREADFSTGCIVVPLGATDYVLPPGDAVAGSLEAEGGTAVLMLTGVAFLPDGVQQRRTIRATFALPLSLPARATAATVTTRTARLGAAVEEETAPLVIVSLERLTGGRVAGDYGGAGSADSGRFDAPVAVSGF